MRRPPSRCNSKIFKASLPQAMAIPCESVDKISPGSPVFWATSAFQIFNKDGFALDFKKINAPGQGMKARKRFEMVCAGSFQSICPSSFLIFDA